MPVRKGLQTASALQAALDEACRASADGLALVETDMRAHLNPTRMAAIRALAFRLVRRIARACPACARPRLGPG
jgi:ubiquinone/menaquinone biosynthesis C-methylase UbiE